MKKCSTCNKHKELDAFAIERRTKDGRRSKCKQCTKEYNQLYADKNKDQLSLYQKEWYQKHKKEVSESSRSYYKKNKNKINRLARMKRKSDPLYKLRRNLRTRLHSALKGNYKKGSTVDLLGCSIGKLKNYLESKFQPGMSWKNYSKTGWHIDHIIPLSSFDLTDETQLRQACHYTNLQPLWTKNNWKKGAKIYD